MPTLVVAALQLCSSHHWPDNQRTLAGLIQQASAAGVRLLVLPENFAAFGVDSTRAIAAQAPAIISWLSQQARDAKLYLVAGTLPSLQRPDGTDVPAGRVRSTTWVFSDQGEIVGRYDKRHLFDVDVGDAQGRYQESLTFEPGSDLSVVATPWGGLGVLTCYDLRFPEQARALRQMGAELLVVPAAFTALTGAAHWHVLLRARAIENQCLVIGAGQGGVHSPTRETWGHSQIIDAWGRVLVEREPAGAGLVQALWDRDEQASIRARMPTQSHRLDGLV